MSKIYYIRHGQSEANLQQIFAGSRIDSPLTELGRQQAKAASADIKARGLKFDHVYVSPLARAQETCQIILQAINHKDTPITDKRLKEYDMGSRTGSPNIGYLSAVELQKSDEAESAADFRLRVKTFMDEVSALEGTVLICAHSFVLRMIQTIIDDAEPTTFCDIQQAKNATLIEIDYST